jgi:arabinofuranosyltransferase
MSVSVYRWERFRLSRVLRLIVIGAPFFWLAGRFWFLCDDAFISFRYGRNWALGHGLRYNLGDHAPVEGYSNFLWVVLCAVVESLRVDPAIWVPAVSLVCGLTLLGLLYRVLIRGFGLNATVATLSVLCLALFPPFAVWATGGLETMAFTLALFVTFERMVLERGNSIAASVAGAAGGFSVALLRTEGIVWALGIGVLSLWSRRARGVEERHGPLIYASIVLGGFGVYYLCRYLYFGLPFPNPVYLKVAFGADVALRGFRYVATFFLTFLTPFLLFPTAIHALRSHPRHDTLPVMALAFAFPAYAIVVGGDWMTMGRFLVPGLPYAAILFGLFLYDLWKPAAARKVLVVGLVLLIVSLGLLPAWNIHLVPRSVRQAFRFMYSHPGFRSEYERWVSHSGTPVFGKEVGLALKDYAEPGDSLVVGAIGAIGYYSELFIYDRLGLVSHEVAQLPHTREYLRSPGHDIKVSRAFFLSKHPTFIIFDVASGSRDRVLLQAEEWKKFSPGLWRLYVPDYVVLDGKEAVEAERVLLLYRSIEENLREPVLSLPRKKRRRVRAHQAERRWDAFYQKVDRLPEGEMPRSRR